MEENQGLPLGMIKQAYLKLESFAGDLYEILEEDIPDEVRQVISSMKESSTYMMANLINIVKAEIGEEEFLGEVVEMDAIEGWPGDEAEIMDQPAE